METQYESFKTFFDRMGVTLDLYERGEEKGNEIPVGGDKCLCIGETAFWFDAGENYIGWVNDDKGGFTKPVGA